MKNKRKAQLINWLPVFILVILGLSAGQAVRAQMPVKSPTPVPTPNKESLKALYDFSFDDFGKSDDKSSTDKSKQASDAEFRAFLDQFDQTGKPVGNQFADADAKMYAEIKAALEKHEAAVKGDDSGTDQQYGTPDKNPINFDDLLRQCETLISHNPQLPDYYRLRGKVRYDRALAGTPYMFIESLSFTNPDFIAKFSAAEVAAGLKDFSAALSIKTTAKLEDVDAADAHLFRGKLDVISAAQNYSKQNLQNALVDFDDFISLDGYELPPDDIRKAIYLLSKDGDLVGQDFARRIKDNPADAQSLYLERAGYYSAIVDYNKARADLLRYANSPAGDLTAATLRYATLNKLAANAYRKTDISTAQEYLEKASLEAEFPENQEAAFQDATAAEKLNPQLTPAYVIRAKYLIGSGKVDEGIAEAYLALLQEPDNVGALCVRGLGLAIKNNVSSLEDFNRAIALDPELAFLYNAFGNRAKIYTALGKTDLAAADTEKSTQLAQVLEKIRH